MTIKIVNSVKYIGFLALILLSIVACEKDFENIDVDLVDNNVFKNDSAIFEVIGYNKNVDSSRVDGLPRNLLGVYKDDTFGFIKTSFVSQLSLPSPFSNFGDSVSIDMVILDIPYYATDTSAANTKPDFILDSIIGDQNIEYNLSVYESGTYLNTLDPQDPSKIRKYYSDEQYDKKTLLSSKLFKPEKHDTVLYVKRRFLDNNINTVDDTDTIIAENANPSIKFELDTVFFRNNFVNQQNSGVFDSNDNLLNYFRGIIIEAEEDQEKQASLMTLNMSEAELRIYYTNTTLTDESGTDLNGNGTTDDTGVPVRTKQTMIFPVGGIGASTYIRDYTGSEINNNLLNPDKINGQEKLFIQGAAGSIAVVELFKGVDIDSLNAIRDQNWLIIDASITLHLNNDETQNSVPERLYLYKFDSHSQILDVFTEIETVGIGGVLIRDEDNNNPIKYKFSITDYMSEVLKHDGITNVAKLGIKVYHPTDNPVALNDSLIKDYSWNAKGVVLNGNNVPLIDADYNNRLKLKIVYTIKNE